MTVIDDYGHHPTEIRATLAAARNAASGRSMSSSSRIATPARSCCSTNLPPRLATPTPLRCSTSMPPAKRRSPASPANCWPNGSAKPRASAGGLCEFIRGSGGTGRSERRSPATLILTLGAGNVSQLGPLVLERSCAEPRLTRQEIASGTCDLVPLFAAISAIPIYIS